jgi:hypothetical protein
MDLLSKVTLDTLALFLIASKRPISSAEPSEKWGSVISG